MPMTNHTRRKLRALTAVGLTLAVAAAAIATHRIASSIGLRIDVTATRAHRLAPTTIDLIRSLETPHEVLVVGSLQSAAIDPWSAQRAKDTLDELAERSPELRVRWIDPATAEGARATLDLLDDLRQRGEPVFSIQREALSKAIVAARDVNAALRALPANSLPPELTERLAPTLINADARLDLADGFLGRSLEGRDIPAIAEARAALAELVAGYRAVGAALEGFPTTQADVAIDALLSAASSALAITPEPSSVAATAIASSETVVVLSRSGVRSIPLSDLFPPPPADASVGVSADAGPRAEAAIARTIRDLSGVERPLVVLVHGESGRVLERTNILSIFRTDLSDRGYDLAEWAPVIEPEPPIAIEDRAVVIYAVIGTDAGTDGSEARFKGPARAARVAAAIEQIIDAGDPLLVSLPPSPLPVFGEQDPMARALRTLGIDADTGRPIMTSQTTPSGRLTIAEHTPTGDAQAPGEIAQAIRGLGLSLPWPVALDLGESGAMPILTLSDERAWAESVWQTYRTIPVEQRVLVRDPPKYEPEAGDERGPWVIAAAVESEAGQRAVVVGSNRWFFDEVARAAGLVDGRTVLATPGNVELLHASLAWLAGDDVPESAERVRVPRIAAMSDGTLLALRLACGLGLPLLILACGGVLAVLGRRQPDPGHRLGRRD